MNVFIRSAWPLCAGLLAICAPWAMAQTSPPNQAQSLKEVVVTGNPLGRDTIAAPVTSLSGTELLLRSGITLGETLSQTPGVSNSYFGPNAGRPIIRGLDGDRIRLLNNGGAAHDLSGLSPDHAVAQDPLSVERIEVLRGPGALLYGGSAVGGVVNVIDNRIAREPQFGAKGGVSGKADLSASTGQRERAKRFVFGLAGLGAVHPRHHEARDGEEQQRRAEDAGGDDRVHRGRDVGRQAAVGARRGDLIVSDHDNGLAQFAIELLQRLQDIIGRGPV